MSHKTTTDILVTGASGFLASNIIEALAERHADWNICGLDIKPPSPKVAKLLREFIHADVTSADSVRSALLDYTPDLVLHTAGIVPARKDRYSTNKKQWEKVKAINYDGTRHVLDAAMASGCKAFVYTSSCTVAIDDLEHDYYYMNESVPIGLATLHYGRSKGLAEQYVLDRKHADAGLAACALRPCTIIGPGDTAVISIFHDQIAKRETNFIVGDGTNFYDFMYISNAVDAHILAAENLLTAKTAAGQAFFISNDEPVYFWDFMAYIWAQFGHVPSYRIHIPVELAWFAALIMELITWFTGGGATLDRGSLKDGIRTQYSNNNKAKHILGYYPKVGLSEGVRRSCDAYKKVLAEQSNGAAPESKKSR